MKNNKEPIDKSKKEKQKYIDDGHTVCDMDGVRSPFDVLRRKKDSDGGLSRKEKRAAIKAALQVYLPIVLGAILCFVFVGVLMYLWLS